MIIGGSSGSGKTSFLYDKNAQNDFSSLGISFKPVECIVNNEDSFKFVVWDLKVRERFRFMFPIFCRGASGAFLCFDLSNYDSFKELPFWIKIFRNNNRNNEGNIPIILIGTKMDLNNRAVSDKEIDDLAKQYELNGVFFTSIHDNDKKSKKEKIFKSLIENIEKLYHISSCSIFIPKEDKYFKNFIKAFSNCPVCKKKNHFDSLKSFYYSRDPTLMILKEKLLELIDKSKYFDDKYYAKINFGILCCNCFKKQNLQNLI
ncbi:MAG: hypothetical protein ACFFAN_15540 [Promethearchaeota archaeon]